MRSAHGLVLLVLLGVPSSAAAQLPFFAGYPVGGFGFNYQRRHVAVSGFWGYPLAPYPVYAWPRTSISIIYQPLPVVVSQPVVIQQPVIVVREKAVTVTEDDQFLRIVPRKREPAPDKLKPEPPRRPEVVPAPPPAAGPAKPPEKPAPQPAARPAPVPRGRSDRLLLLGMTAFADRLHGRAERFFLKATEVPPVDPLAYFYLGQAQFARAEYQEAVASIQAGLRILPEWVRSPFRSDELYAPHTDDFKEHLQRLEETLARHPADPHLLFLYGYELWFMGRHEEARTQFQRAAAVMPDAGLIQLFLNARLPMTQH
jgi:hypothetical protein